ncbi:MAG: hypothetical protein ACK5OX_18065 [Desertimonas sp.]
MIISCDDCARQHTATCEDCVVTYLVGADRHGVEIARDDVRAVRLLAGAGLVPRLRHAIR